MIKKSCSAGELALQSCGILNGQAVCFLNGVNRRKKVVMGRFWRENVIVDRVAPGE